ncbi:MAG: bifunctional UDP-sugar hydrolase/5'-nucleotidase [Candidatus Rokuibacteriota bacterium]
MTGRRSRLLVALAVVAWSACAGPATTSKVPERQARVTFLHINDAYELEAVDGGRRGGMARLATLVKRLRARHPAAVFTHGGDAISPSVMSSYLRGEQMIAALNAIGLDVATIGNHEFDFGPAVLRQRMSESKFTWLSANVLDRATGRPFGGARAEMLVTAGGVRVGFFGLTMTQTQTSSSPGDTVEFRAPAAAALETSRRLRAAGAQLVAAVTHQDMAADRALAAAPGMEVDVILGGHEHEPLVAEEGRTLIVKAGSDARYLVQVDVWLDARGNLVERSWTFHEVSARVPPDAEVASLARRYEVGLSRELDRVIGRTAVALEARQTPLRTRESNLGNFIADAMRARAGADVALVNGGGIRTDRVIAPGPLSRRDVHGLLPFTNAVVTLEMRGLQLRAALEEGLAGIEREAGGFLQVSGLRVVHDLGRPPGHRVREVAVGGAPLDGHRLYTVATIDYLARGGDGFTAFRPAPRLVSETSGPQLADVVLEAILAQGTIAPGIDGRLTAAPR